MKNEDNLCLGYIIIASRVPQTKRGHRNRPTEYNKYFKIRGVDKIQYSVEDGQGRPLEVTLNTNVSVFSFYDDEGTAPFSLYVSDKHYNRSADLLNWQGHFALITNFERFLYFTGMKAKNLFCRKSLGHFMRQDALALHTSSANGRASRTPSTLCLHLEKTIMFMNVRFQQRMPFLISADCEPLCTPHNETWGQSQFYSEHVPC